MARKLDLKTEKNPKEHGTYRRRTDDIFHAVKLLNIETMSDDAAFVFYYLACEKIAKVMVGLSEKKPGATHFHKIHLRTDNIAKACHMLGFKMSDSQIQSIFSNDPISASTLRNQLFHDIGRTHVIQIQRAAPRLNNEMRKFLDSRDAIISYLDNATS